MMIDAVAKTPQEAASEYYQVDWVIGFKFTENLH